MLTIPDHIAGLIFDCDGTLADTMPAHFRAWQIALAPSGLKFDEAKFFAMGGMPTQKIIEQLSLEQGIPADAASVAHAKESAFLQSIREVTPLEPVVEIARTQRGVRPLAVATGGYREVIEITLAHIGLRDWFEAVVTAEDTAKHKPHPDVYLEAARRLGIEPERCMVFEDTDIGLEAARRAKMLEIDVRPWVGRTR